jgi:hypothetical protein
MLNVKKYPRKRALLATIFVHCPTKSKYIKLRIISCYTFAWLGKRNTVQDECRKSDRKICLSESKHADVRIPVSDTAKRAINFIYTRYKLLPNVYCTRNIILQSSKRIGDLAQASVYVMTLYG